MPRSEKRALTENDLPLIKPTFLKVQRQQPLLLKPDFNIPQKAFTITAWLRNENSGSAKLFAIKSDKKEEISLTKNSKDQLELNINGKIIKTAIELPCDRRWNYLTLSVDLEKTDAKISVNQNNSKQISFDSRDINLNGLHVKLGGLFNKKDFDLAELKIFDVLEDTQIKSYFQLTAKKYQSFCDGEFVNFDSKPVFQFAADQILSKFFEQGCCSSDKKAKDIVQHGEIELNSGTLALRCKKKNDIGNKSVTITGWLRQPQHNNGVIFDALSSDGKKGFSIRHDFFPKIYVKIGEQDQPLGHPKTENGGLYMKGFNQPTDNKYYFFAVVIDNDQKKILFWEDNKLYDENIKFKADNLCSDEPVAFAKYCPKSRAQNHYPFYGGMFDVKVYNRKLSEEQIRSDFNKYADVFGYDKLTGKQKTPSLPLWHLSPATYAPDRFIPNMRPSTAEVEHLEYDNRNCVRIKGNGSCGVDTDGFESEIDSLEIELPVRVDYPLVSKELRFMSIGDEGQILVGLLYGDQNNYYIRINGKWEKAGPFELKKWNLIKLSINNDKLIACNNKIKKEFVVKDLTQRIYLGDGYPEIYIARADKFWIDTSNLSTNIKKLK